ncbi:MAG TPA: type IV pilus biogenesis/stability protein PilW [Telluria sp.]|nr:type IV pilus biogenesis/stability protein PilW [Telluria sp.]
MSAALLRLASGAVALCLLAACAGSGPAPQELKTASDQTAAEKRAAIRLQLAVGYFQDGKYEIALDEVKQAIAVNPQSADAFGVRGLIYAAMNETALADENFQHALKLAPKSADLANNYGSFLCTSGGKPAQGLQYLEQALKNPAYQSPVNALVNAGNCSLKLKNTEAAERYLLDALRYAPDLAAVNAALVRVYYERRDYVRAGFFVNRLTDTAKLDALSADTLWLALKVERKLGNRELEKSLASQLAKRFPGSPEYAAMQRGAFDE